MLGQTLCRPRSVCNRLPVARAGVIDYGDVAQSQLACDRIKFRVLLRQHFERAFHIHIHDGFVFAFDGQAFVFRQLKFRRGFNRRGKLQIFPATELDFLNVRIANDGDFFLVQRLAIGIADEFAFDLVFDVQLVLF